MPDSQHDRPVALIVEDDMQIRRFVRLALEAEGWQVSEAPTRERGLIESGTRRPDLVILDLGLPDGDGLGLVRELRNWSGVPVIVLSARDREEDKVAALDAGADDYLTKPFGVGELLARTRAQLRRWRAQGDGAVASSTVRFGEVEVDLAARRVVRAGEEVHLTPTEYRLLGVLIANAGRVVTQRQLLREVWGKAYDEQTHYTRIVVANLRRKLEAEPARPQHLLTELGVGYRLMTDG